MSRLGPHRKHNRRDPCLVCEGTTSYCITFEDGWTSCGHKPNLTGQRSGLGWLHWTGDGVPPSRTDWRDTLPPPAPIKRQLSDERHDQIIRALLEPLSLSQEHRAGLHGRGFTDDDIAALWVRDSFTNRFETRAIAAAAR